MNLFPTLKNLTNSTYGQPQEAQNSILQGLGSPHISSFNYMVDQGLDEAVKNLNPVQFNLPTGERVCVRITDASLSCPLVPTSTIGVKDRRIWPLECRQRAGTYKGTLSVNIECCTDNTTLKVAKDMGEVPIMLKSNRCHLAHMTGKQLVANGEHEQEWGGYFIIKGHEKLIRMLLLTRRNYPVAVKRSTWKTRGVHFSDLGVLIRCVSNDHTTVNNVLHFVTDGTVKLMISANKQLYYMPLMLIMKALCNYKDQFIYKRLTEGYEDNLYYTSCIQNMLRAIHEESLHTDDDCKTYIGRMFRSKVFECPEWFSDIEITEHIFKHRLLIHLSTPEDKFNLLIFMTQKLFSLVENRCKVEGVDAVMMQEVLLGGHLYLQIVKDKLQSFLNGVRLNILKRAASSIGFCLNQLELGAALKSSGGLESAMENFLSTGNVTSTSGLGLQQDKGLVIIAENINRMRYMSHFRAVHRGTFFQEMRTTEARQLLPDAWGFICPVHTPDGSPCGLLNHLALNCFLTDVPDARKLADIPLVLAELGMTPIANFFEQKIQLHTHYVVQLDGRVLGHCEVALAHALVHQLRVMKIEGTRVPNTLEIVLVPIREVPGQYPGLFLFTGPARMMRPLINLVANRIEYVGTFEQVYLDVCVTSEEAYKGVTTHMEVAKSAFLSNLAQLIPMPDCNQSPRNMYQCQMGKQTMGTPCHTWTTQAETKLYRLQTPATPLFRPAHYDMLQLDDFAMGTNAVVAVISYTGYDMEDAMIISKSAYERGFAHGSIYKSQFIQLDHPDFYFCRDPNTATLSDFLDTDGLPFKGRLVSGGEPLYCYYDTEDSKYMTVKSMSKEAQYIDKVTVCGNFNAKSKKVACITYRIPRNPSVGDKFASRAGQKGICSQKWPSEDLPFTETGLVPDIIFNPHGFPSRMTIAMMIELMSGKSGAMHGLVHDASPFKFDENNTAIDYFGRLLEAGGYNYYGTETMYSGIDGRELPAQIFFGIVHYQRLRHMVSDKWQVRSTGPMDIITKQPVGGRKRGGGVRFGEMERDSLISHGTSFILQDRLLNCSDKATAFICTDCGSLLSPVTVTTRKNDKKHLNELKETCRVCESDKNIAEIEIPYIFKFLVTQLASVNINVKINCKHV